MRVNHTHSTGITPSVWLMLNNYQLYLQQTSSMLHMQSTTNVDHLFFTAPTCVYRSPPTWPQARTKCARHIHAFTIYRLHSTILSIHENVVSMLIHACLQCTWACVHVCMCMRVCVCACACSVLWCACSVLWSACSVLWCACSVLWCACSVPWCACSVLWYACSVLCVCMWYAVRVRVVCCVCL